MFNVMATYQLISITALKLTMELMFKSVNATVLEDIVKDIDEENQAI